jgi:hypothetical protein
MERTEPPTIAKGDIVRARRLGNKTRATYVIDRIGDQYLADAVSVKAHRRYSQGRGQYMLLATDGLRVLGTYR